MQIEVVLAAAFEIVGERSRHPAIGFLKPQHLPRRGALRGEPCGGGLDAGAQLQQRHQEFLVGRRIRHPCKHIGIENVPAFLRPHDRAAARARFDQPLGGERAQPLSQRGPADAQLAPKIGLDRQQRAGRKLAFNDVAPDRIADGEPLRTIVLRAAARLR